MKGLGMGEMKDAAYAKTRHKARQKNQFDYINDE
jgi:hypothetical protein